MSANGNTKGKGIEPGCLAMIVGITGDTKKNNGKTVKVESTIAVGSLVSLNGREFIIGPPKTQGDKLWVISCKDPLTVRILPVDSWKWEIVETMGSIVIEEKNLIRIDDPSELTDDDVTEIVNNLKQQTEQKILSDAINNMLNGN